MESKITMRNIFIVSINLLFIFIAGCSSENNRDVRDYYFPIKQLQNGCVYEYRAFQQDSLAPDYWYYLGLPTDTALYFTKTAYRGDFTQQQLTRERLVHNGLLTEDFFLFETDSSGLQQHISAEIKAANAFPFYVTQDTSDMYLFKVRFQLPSQPNGHTTLVINRRFAGDTTFTFAQEQHPAIRFNIVGLVDQRDSIIGDIEPHFWGEEIYAKGLGLVAYHRTFEYSTTGLQYQLADTLSMQNFTERARKSIK